MTPLPRPGPRATSLGLERPPRELRPGQLPRPAEGLRRSRRKQPALLGTEGSGSLGWVKRRSTGPAGRGRRSGPGPKRIRPKVPRPASFGPGEGAEHRRTGGSAGRPGLARKEACPGELSRWPGESSAGAGSFGPGHGLVRPRDVAHCPRESHLRLGACWFGLRTLGPDRTCSRFGPGSPPPDIFLYRQILTNN